MESWSSPLRWLQGEGPRDGAAGDSPTPSDQSLPPLPENWRDGAVVVVLDFLHRCGYSSAALALESETGIQLEDLEEDLFLLRSWILEGRWSHCDEYLGALANASEAEREGLDIVGAVSACKKAEFFELLAQKDRPAPVNELVNSLEVIEKSCTTECFNECCHCMSLKSLRDHPLYGDWTRDKGRSACFEAVRRCLEYKYNKRAGVPRRSVGSNPRLETVMRRARAWLDLQARGAEGVRPAGEGRSSPLRASGGLGSPRPASGGEDYAELSSAAAYHTDELIDLCDKLNEKAEDLTRSAEGVPAAGSGRGGGASPAGGGRPGTPESRGKIRDISNSGGGSPRLCHHDLPCSPGYLAEPKRSPKAGSRGGSPRRTPPSSPSRVKSTAARSLRHSLAKATGYGSQDISRGFVCRQAFKDTHPVRCLGFCRGADFLALGCNRDKTLRVFQPSKGSEGALEEIFNRRRHHDGSIYCLEWRRRNNQFLIVTGSNDHQVKLLTTFDFRGDSTATLCGHNGTVRDLSLSESGGLLASGGGGDNGIRLWDVETQRRVGELFSHAGAVTGLCFMGGQEHAYYAADSTGALVGWDSRSEEPTVRFSGLRSEKVGVSSLAAKGNHLAVGYADGCFQVLDPRRPGPPLFEKFVHSLECRSLDFSPDGSWLLSTSFDCMAHVVLVRDGSLVCSSRGHDDKVVQGEWDPSRVRFATCGVDGTVQMHEPRQPLGSLPADLLL